MTRTSSSRDQGRPSKAFSRPDGRQNIPIRETSEINNSGKAEGLINNKIVHPFPGSKPAFDDGRSRLQAWSAAKMMRIELDQRFTPQDAAALPLDER